MGKEDTLLQPKNISIQDRLLNQMRKENVAVTIHLMNGFQIKGLVKAFDNYVIVVDSDGKQLIIFKHAVSTITPQRAVKFAASATGEQDTIEE
ncbi:MAG: RNA chaperone Hfq [Clostridiales bacterium]|nr:RNA chaperone Hfq [Clostridiales bacterium]